MNLPPDRVLIVYLPSAALLTGAAYIVFRIIVRRDYLRIGRVTVISLLLELLICFLYCNFPYIYLPFDWPELPTLPESSAHRILGLIPIGVGLAIALTGIVTLDLQWFLGFGSEKLQPSGIYSLSRNPQIVGFFLAILGFALLWPSWYALGWVLLYFPIFHMMVLSEEEYLASLHGEEYRRYCDRVPRYVGLVRKSDG